MQELNGVDFGVILHSRHSATEIINHIGTEMRKRVIEHIVKTTAKLAIIIDESTTSGNKAVMTIHMKTDLGTGEPVFAFLELMELESQTAECITTSLLECLHKVGPTETYLQRNWIAFTSDGASNLTGSKTGVATRLKSVYPNLTTWHCLSHRLELAVGDSVVDVRGVNHFKIFPVPTVFSF